MTVTDSIEARIAIHYGGLSGKLREAANYVASNQFEVASRSLRSVSASSKVSPATFSRLARALGFDSYEDMRELSRSTVNEKVLSFSEKADRLRRDPQGATTMLERQTGACMANIAKLTHDIDEARLAAAVKVIGRARQVLVFGAFASTGMAEYMAYLGRHFTPNWAVAGRMGASLAADLTGLGANDVLIVVTKAPYVRRAVTATQIARESGASTVLLTDHHTCPALPYADHGFVVPSDSPQFFSSYTATLVLIETMIAMIIATSRTNASSHIREVEEKNRRLEEFWAD